MPLVNCQKTTRYGLSTFYFHLVIGGTFRPRRFTVVRCAVRCPRTPLRWPLQGVCPLKRGFCRTGGLYVTLPCCRSRHNRGKQRARPCGSLRDIVLLKLSYCGTYTWQQHIRRSAFDTQGLKPPKHPHSTVRLLARPGHAISSFTSPWR